VVLRVRVTAEGVGEAVVVEESSGHALLDRSALSAVRRWRFLSATRGGVAVAGEIAIPILFRLDDGKP
jgi:protein TonB